MKNKLLIAALMLMAVPVMAIEVPPPIPPAVKMQPVGSGKMSTVLFDVYDIALYSPTGKYDPAQPVALSIRYDLSIDGADIADRSRDEMKRQNIPAAKLDAWKAEMKRIFPDVKDGTVLSALCAPGKPTTFYKDGHAIGTITDPEFGKAFAGIWLSQHTSEPKLREELISYKTSDE